MKIMKIAVFGIVACYGRLGHTLTGLIAQKLLGPEAVKLLLDLIPQYEGLLEKATNWGDQIKSNPKYNWAKKLHYIDAHDFPPQSCFINTKTGTL
jgi:hypothetical protein